MHITVIHSWRLQLEEMLIFVRHAVLRQLAQLVMNSQHEMWNGAAWLHVACEVGDLIGVPRR